jgi:hypothetical protein
VQRRCQVGQHVHRLFGRRHCQGNDLHPGVSSSVPRQPQDLKLPRRLALGAQDIRLWPPGLSHSNDKRRGLPRRPDTSRSDHLPGPAI